MIDIYICEDDEFQRNLIEHYVKNSVLIHEYDMKLLLSTGDPHSILEKAQLSKNTGLYFLDICLGTDMNGLILAQKIREIDARCFIVLITSHSEMSLMTFQYKVEALDFILKDNPSCIQERIDDCIKNVDIKYSNIKKGIGKTFSFTKNGKKQTFSYVEILFFETSSKEHKVSLHTFDKCIEFFGKMKEIEKQLGEDFIRCHRAFLVNRNNILEINYNQRKIILKNGSECLISYRMIKHLKSLL